MYYQMNKSSEHQLRFLACGPYRAKAGGRVYEVETVCTIIDVQFVRAPFGHNLDTVWKFWTTLFGTSVDSQNEPSQFWTPTLFALSARRCDQFDQTHALREQRIFSAKG